MVMGKTDDGSFVTRKRLWIAGAVAVAFLLVWFLFAPGRGYVRHRQLQREIESLTQENSRLESKNAELVEDIRRLKSDEAYIEDVARKKHGLLKKDEMVYEFESTKRK